MDELSVDLTRLDIGNCLSRAGNLQGNFRLFPTITVVLFQSSGLCREEFSVSPTNK